MEGVYYFGEQLRWNLGWENPNQAGAFLVTLIPLMWGLLEIVGRSRTGESRRSWLRLVSVVLLILVEAGLWFLLCKTYSRGALVSIVVSAVVYVIFRSWKVEGGRRRKSIMVDFVLRAVFVLILLFFTEFIGRVKPAFVVADASAGNRLSLWRGGVRMVVESPLHGWGKGESGRQFMHWFQSFDADERYAGMVNSYLHVAVERGLLMMALNVAVILGFVVLGLLLQWSGNRKFWKGPLGIAASGSLIAFLVANVFSTLWIFGWLWVVPAIAALFLLMCLVLDRGLKKGVTMWGLATAAGGAVAIGLAGGVFLYGRLMGGEVDVRLHRGKGVLLRSLLGSERAIPVVIVPDSVVLGETFGKEARRLVLDDRFRSLEVFVPLYGERDQFGGIPGVPKSHATAEAILCGGWCSSDLSGHSFSRVLFVHPTRPPAKATLKWLRKKESVGIMLPEIDISGQNRQWEQLARNRGWELMVNRGVAQDIRGVWPACLERWYSIEAMPSQ